MYKSMIRAAVVSTVTAGVLAAIAAPPAQALDYVCVFVHIDGALGSYDPGTPCIATPFEHRHEEAGGGDSAILSVILEVYYPYIECPLIPCPPLPDRSYRSPGHRTG
jgi:hypothetical protein